MARKELTKAVAYFRTSSMTNVGEDTDTLKRQRSAVEGFAKRAGYELVAEYSDDGVKGADPVDSRPGFAAMLQHVAGNGVRTVIVERPRASLATSSRKRPAGGSFGMLGSR
jgi:DNA invertase Pin-like site-specific DNA recombinase